MMQCVMTAIVGMLTLFPSADDSFRTWKDKSGSYSVVAKYVKQSEQKVTLEKEDGSTIEVEINRLSPDDRRWLQRLNRKPRSTSKPKRVEVKSEATTTGSSLESSSNNDKGWPSWRGPDRTGVSKEKGLMQSWPKDGPEVLWTANGLGKGFSSVAIADDKIFTIGNIGGRQNVVCLSMEGEVQWKTPFAEGGDPNCTPTFSDGLVYAVSRDGTLVCVQADNGDKVWSVSYASDFGGKMMSQWGYSESPLVDGDKIICTPGSASAMIAALNKKTGKLIWKTPMRDGGSKGKDGAGYASVVISNAGGVKQYVTLVGRGVIGVEAKTGQPLWQYEKVANTTANVPTPIIDGDYVFCSSGYGDGGSALLQLKRSGRQMQVREVYYYSAREVQNHHGGMILIDGHIYMGNGHNKGFPLCLEMRTGKIKWGGRLRGEGDGSAAIVAADGQLYFRYEDAKMALIEVNPREYKVNGSFSLPIRNGKSWAHPVVLDGKMYLRDQDQLLCMDVKAK